MSSPLVHQDWEGRVKGVRNCEGIEHLYVLLEDPRMTQIYAEETFKIPWDIMES